MDYDDDPAVIQADFVIVQPSQRKDGGRALV
jgi:hypothetical protein